VRKSTFKKRINNIINRTILLERLEALESPDEAKLEVSKEIRAEVNKLISSYRG
jgi:hypothetical protein